jgi:hypothetical protein
VTYANHETLRPVTSVFKITNMNICGRKAGRGREIMRDNECNSETKEKKKDLKNVT